MSVRLSVLLKQFRLPLDATVRDLRRAYLREAKRLHPDANPSGDLKRATRDFTQLRSDFDEALKLFAARTSPLSESDFVGGYAQYQQ
ncbi:unnamed protein product, partial [Polarella glacialis]